MEDVLFSESFRFFLYRFDTYHYRNNSTGCDVHFVGHMLKGAARIETVDGERMEIVEGDYFYIPKGLKYRSYWYGEGEVLFESFGFAYLPDPRAFSLQKLPPSGAYREALAEVDPECTSCENIGRFYRALGMALDSMERRYESGHEAILQTAISYMKEHRDFRISEVAQHAKVSESGLYAIFREVKGMTPIEMKWQLQVEEAKPLLAATDLSVEEIAGRCGFSSGAYFRKIFKRVTGVSPSRMRRDEAP